MEAAGLGIGIIGLAGLFTSCLDAVDKISSYRSSRTDAQDLDAQLEADKLRFAQWGREVGFDKGNLADSHHPKLDDEDTLRAVRRLLLVIQKICEPGARGSGNLARIGSGLAENGESRWRRAAWAVRGKEVRSKQVELLGKVIQQLHDLVSPGERHKGSIGQASLEGASVAAQDGKIESLTVCCFIK